MAILYQSKYFVLFQVQRAYDASVAPTIAQGTTSMKRVQQKVTVTRKWNKVKRMV